MGGVKEETSRWKEEEEEEEVVVLVVVMVDVMVRVMVAIGGEKRMQVEEDWGEDGGMACGMADGGCVLIDRARHGGTQLLLPSSSSSSSTIDNND
ncbi:unnamed protein product [Hydatigera taeniaeformis]|uniref:Uncharacterized protein n=1 Tax=Hydatigena taeniaeformis TaxID=6205 RepID=A0A0R3XDL9_HYDTA|nr:unnamed protein product [Hydatigera taeniaeformis]